MQSIDIMGVIKMDGWMASGIDNSNPSQPFNCTHFPAPTPMNYLRHNLDIIYYITPHPLGTSLLSNALGCAI